MKKAELEQENKILKEELSKCLPVVEEAYWDHSSAGNLPGSGYNHRCYDKLPFNWRETEEFSKWSKKLKKIIDVGDMMSNEEITPQIAEYWVEIDPETKNPTGNICWAYYAGDLPAVGYWIKVREIDGVSNQKEDTDPLYNRDAR